MCTPSMSRRVQRVRFEARRRVVTVRSVERISKNFVRIIFQGSDLSDFQSMGFDDHVKIVVPVQEGKTELRDFTPLEFDTTRAELTIDFALHDTGPASNWARQARPGTQVTIFGPRGSMVVPADYTWALLAGDASALPAITRRLRELPAETKVIVLAEVSDRDDERLFSTRAHMDLIWVRSSDAWLERLKAISLPSGEGYVWCAGEAQVMKTAREIFLEHHKQPREALHVATYWKQGNPGFHEQLIT